MTDRSSVTLHAFIFPIEHYTIKSSSKSSHFKTPAAISSTQSSKFPCRLMHKVLATTAANYLCNDFRSNPTYGTTNHQHYRRTYRRTDGRSTFYRALHYMHRAVKSVKLGEVMTKTRWCTFLTHGVVLIETLI